MFCEKLKELRKNSQMSMDILAEIYNKKFGGKLNKSTISRYENGLQEPLFTVVKNFADLFGVSIDFLINDEYDVPIERINTATDITESLTNEEKQLIKSYNSLDEIDRAEIRGEIKQMLKADKYTAFEGGSITADITDTIHRLNNSLKAKTPTPTK